MKKYNIVKVDNLYKIEILETFLFHKDAIEYLTSLIDKTYKSEIDIRNYKVYYEQKDEITVNWLGYLSKGLCAKYYIIAYEDNTANPGIQKSN